MHNILVTGANRGLGLEFVRQYEKEGARIFACARIPGEARALLDIAQHSKGRVTVHPLDVASDASVSHLAAEVAGEPIDILINNAGVYGGEHQQVGDIDYEAWMRTLNINTLGPARVFEALRGNLIKGRERKAIAITSRMGSTAEHGGGALIYRSSKAALNNVVKGLSLAFKTDGLIVVAVHPGWVRTDMGGESATLAPEQSILAMRTLIGSLKLAQSGHYFNYDGAEIKW